MGVKLNCQHCGGRMVKAKVNETGCVMALAIALILIAAGVLIFVMIPIAGWIIGPVVIICGLFYGGRKSKVWRCENCRAIIARG